MREAPSYESGYIDSYDANNSDLTMAGSFLQKSHAALEKTLPKMSGLNRILEVGAGSGHHFRYVKGFEKYVMTDGNEGMLRIASEKYSAEMSACSLVIEKQDATRLTYPDNSFDRLIATHVLEHLPNPVDVLREWNRVVRPGGLISLVLPCDPGLLWRFGRHMGPRRNARRRGIEYDYLQAAEHVNSVFNLVVFIRHHFNIVHESWYPFKLPLPDLNLFYISHLEKEQDKRAGANV